MLQVQVQGSQVQVPVLQVQLNGAQVQVLQVPVQVHCLELVVCSVTWVTLSADGDAYCFPTLLHRSRCNLGE